jgi:hypothetical protein
MSVSHLLIDTCNVERSAEVESTPGRWTKTPAIVQVGTPCRIHVLAARERWNADQEQTEATHAGYFEPSNDVGRDDVVIHVTKQGAAVSPPIRYRVISRNLPSKAHHVKVVMQEIQQA